MADNKVAKFIHGDRIVHVIDIPDDEVEAYIEELRQQVEKLNAERDARPGFIK